MSSTADTFVHTYLLDRCGGGRMIEPAETDAWRAEQGILWVHLDVNNPAAQRWLRAFEGMDAIVVDAMLAGDSRPRAMPDEAALFVNLRGVNTNPGSNPEDMVSIRIWLERDRIVTTRRRRLLSVQDLRASIEQGRGPKTSGEFLVVLIEALANRIGGVVDDIENSIDALEDRVAAGNIRKLQSELGVLRRQTAAIRRYLTPQRDALNRLHGDNKLLTRDETESLREQSDRMTRYLEELDLARERAILAHEELTNRLAQEQNSRLYILSVVAAIFLPLSFLTGLLGMNVAGLPGTSNPAAFLISVVSMLSSAVILVVLFKWKRWI